MQFHSLIGDSRISPAESIFPSHLAAGFKIFNNCFAAIRAVAQAFAFTFHLDSKIVAHRC